MTDQRQDVQWAQSSGGGVRSWAWHGIGRVHRRDPARPWRTLCGVKIAPSSRLLYPTRKEIERERCKRCARIMATFVAVLALALVGCGDDDDSPPVSVPKTRA